MEYNEIPINRSYGRSRKTYSFQGRQDGGKRARREFGGELEFSFNYYVFLLFLIAM
jgi:hypothetical protein